MALDLDWTIIRNASIALGLSIMIGGGLFTASTIYREDRENEYNRQHRRYLDMSGKYLTVDEEERIIKSYYPLYKSLERDGVIGEEQRLDWVDTLRAVAVNIKLPSLRYEISARAPYKPDYALDTGVFQLYASQISLRMGLFHEGDLVTMLDALNLNSPGIFSVKSCKLSRSSGVLQRNPARENIKADCQLRWVTLKPRDSL